MADLTKHTHIAMPGYVKGKVSVEPVVAIGKWKNNGEFIADVARLGYLNGHVLDPTYGKGTWWKMYEPRSLIACDLNEEKSPLGSSVDFTALPWDDRTFDSVCFDPPYKLNGTPDPVLDERYGVEKYAGIDGRHKLMIDGLKECIRVVKKGGYVLVKCQDQVSSGKVQWQTDLMTECAVGEGARKVDSLLYESYRKQPSGRSQVHARRNYSTLLVFKKERGNG